MNAIFRFTAMIWVSLRHPFAENECYTSDGLQLRPVPAFCGLTDIATNRRIWVLCAENAQPVELIPGLKYREYHLRESIVEFEGEEILRYQVLSRPSKLPHTWAVPLKMQVLPKTPKLKVMQPATLDPSPTISDVPENVRYQQPPSINV